MVDKNIQDRILSINVKLCGKRFNDVPESFYPWECGLSASTMYNCSLPCRKKQKIKTQEVKWISIKRWVSTTPAGVKLPPGTFLSIKRSESFISGSNPYFNKIEYCLVMLPYGNVWFMTDEDEPISEEWLWSESDIDDVTNFETLVKKDVETPVQGYFRSAYALFQKEKQKESVGLDNILWIGQKNK